jgi:hypothetical protein
MVGSFANGTVFNEFSKTTEISTIYGHERKEKKRTGWSAKAGPAEPEGGN